jgi:hypothetical protein
MITKAIILSLHELSIIKYGGSHEVRDEGGEIKFDQIVSWLKQNTTTV